MRRYGVLLGLALGICAARTAPAQAFYLIATVTPPGSGSSSHDVLRYALSGTGADVVNLPSIPAAQVNDPSHAVFRTWSELLIANRHGNSGVGSISRFTISADGATVTPIGTITGNGLANVHQIDVNPLTGELFAVCIGFGGRISRFTFLPDGSAVPHGIVYTGQSGLRGLALRRTGSELVSISYNEGIQRYEILEDGSLTLLQTLPYSSGNSPHYGKFLRDELYVAHLYANYVARYKYDVFDRLYLYQTIPVTGGPIDVAFSQDEQEMFVAKHLTGGIDRFAYNQATDTWTYTRSISSDYMGGIATTYSPRILGDANHDGHVNVSDFLILAAAYETSEGDPAYDVNADFTLDGTVNLDDFLILAANYEQ